jgi:hypothetical protein
LTRDPGSAINIPDHIGIIMLKFFVADPVPVLPWIRDGKIWINISVLKH